MKRILVVEDEEEIRKLLLEGLGRKGYEVILASNGQEALSICKDTHLDLILLDVAMPGIDGYQTCEKIKQDVKTKDINILFLTGKDLEPSSIAKRCEELGARGYISKLATFADLLKKVKEVIGH